MTGRDFGPGGRSAEAETQAQEAEGGHLVRLRVWMAEQDAIWSRAREDLILVDHQGHEDVFLWEHATRVARSTRVIGALPEVSGHKLDHAALTAAALYHDSGWAIQFRQGAIDRAAILGRPTSREQRELAIGLLEKRLVSELPTPSLQLASKCIEALDQRDTDIVEAQVLADADSLDHMGPLLLCQIVRGVGLEGKGVQTMVAKWRTKKTYGFWKSCIDAFFRFESVRIIARRRLEKVDRFMADLACQDCGEDLEPEGED